MLGVLGALLLGAASTGPIGAADAASCPNEALRASQVSSELEVGTVAYPACLALEMVSPPKKFGQEVAELSAFSADGARALFRSKAALAGTPGQHSLVGDQYIGQLIDGGWSSIPTSPPAAAAITSGAANVGGPFAFDSELGRWIGFGATQSQTIAGEGQVYRGSPDSFEALSPVLKPIDDSGTANIVFFTAKFRTIAASADLSTAIFGPHLASTAYFPDDPRWETGFEGHANVYLSYLDGSDTPRLELLARDLLGVVRGAGCGAVVGGPGGMQGAVAPDGSRIYFSTRPGEESGTSCDTGLPLRIFVRTGTALGPEISELVDAAGIEGGDDLFQGASLDGDRLYFTSPRSLAASDLDPSPEHCSSDPGDSNGCDLYLYDWNAAPGARLVQVSAGEAGSPQPGVAADVLGVAAVSGDGSRVYFVAEGALTAGPNPRGKVPVVGEPNLYGFDAESGETAFIGTLTGSDRGEVWGVQGLMGSAYAVPLGSGAAGGTGRFLVFGSDASLVPGDQDGGFRDLYRYDAETGSLDWLTGPDSGGPSAHPSDVLVNANEFPPTANLGQQGRWVSEDASTLAFATAEPLVDGDDDGEVNPYLLKDGVLARIPASVTKRTQRPVVSMDGEAIGFTTTARLLPRDGDTARDAYVLRVGGGFPEPTPPVPCDPSSGACQGQAPPPPPVPSMASGSFVGSGNVRGRPACRGKLVRRKGSCVRPRCRSGFVRKKGRCVKRKKGSKKRRRAKAWGHRR